MPLLTDRHVHHLPVTSRSQSLASVLAESVTIDLTLAARSHRPVKWSIKKSNTVYLFTDLSLCGDRQHTLAFESLVVFYTDIPQRSLVNHILFAQSFFTQPFKKKKSFQNRSEISLFSQKNNALYRNCSQQSMHHPWKFQVSSCYIIGVLTHFPSCHFLGHCS